MKKPAKKKIKSVLAWALFCTCHGSIARDDRGDPLVFGEKPPEPPNSKFIRQPVRIVAVVAKRKK